MFGNHSCLFPISHALSADPRRVSICSQHVVLVASFLLDGVLWADLGRVFLRFVVQFVWFDVGDSVDVRDCGTFFFISSAIVHVPEAQKRDGVTVTSKSLSLSVDILVLSTPACDS